MGIVSAVLETRKNLPVITADGTANISGGKGSYQFKYASLQRLLDVVVPALASNGVLLLQKVCSSDERPQLIEVTTELLMEKESITSGALRIHTDGSLRDIAGRVTSAKRIQLVALLGLSVADEVPSGRNGRDDYRPRPQAQAAPAQKAQAATRSYEEAEPLRKAVQRSNGNKTEGTQLATLKMRIQQADKQGGNTFPTEPREGKTTSMYEFLLDRVAKAGASDPEVTLSYLYGRVISKATPPSYATKFLVDELVEGKHGSEFSEVERVVKA